MKNRKAKSEGKKGRPRVVSRIDQGALSACFAGQDALLVPLLELVQDARASIDELMNETARCFVEQLLVISAQEVAGGKHPGRAQGDVRWHGTQPGRITLAERKLTVKRPRLRTKGKASQEVPVPVYERLRAEPQLGQRVRDILVTGVSTRKYAKVLPAMAGSVGITKSSISRKFIKAAKQSLETLMCRRFEEVGLLAVYLDGIVVDGHHILAAVGLDDTGYKHLLGLAQGSSENARVAKDLLTDLVTRGLDPHVERLFIIDGSKALRAAIDEVFGERAHVQRCRAHKVRNVIDRLPKVVAAQIGSVMHAAYQLPEKEGIAKLKQQAKWLTIDYPDASASLLEGLTETFTVNRLKLTPALVRCLATTNIIENPNGAVRRVTGRVTRYRDAEMALRWTAVGFLEGEKSFRRLQGYKDQWVLATALGRTTKQVDANEKAA